MRLLRNVWLVADEAIIAVERLYQDGDYGISIRGGRQSRTEIKVFGGLQYVAGALEIKDKIVFEIKNFVENFQENDLRQRIVYYIIRVIKCEMTGYFADR